MNQEITKIEQEQAGIAGQVNALSIVNQTTYEDGASLKITLASFRKKLNLFFDPMVSKAKDSYDEIRGTRDKYLKPTVSLEETVKSKLRAYEREMEKKAEEARRKAEEERQKKIDKENEKNKVEADAFGTTAEEVKPEDIEIEQPLPTIDKIKGLGIRTAWRWKIVDESKIPKKYWMLNHVMINLEVRTNKEKTGIPGIEAFED